MSGTKLTIHIALIIYSYSQQMDQVSRTTKYRRLRRLVDSLSEESSVDLSSTSMYSSLPSRDDEDPDSFDDCFENLSDDGSVSSRNSDCTEGWDDCPEASGDVPREPRHSSLWSRLAGWANDFNISHSALLSLLAILSQIGGLGLPKDPRTLLQTTNTTKTRDMGRGSYCYLGLKQAILSIMEKHPSVSVQDILCLQLNIDGLPLFKSSSLSLWPILGVLKGVCSTIFAIAIFCGVEKPPLDDFLNDFASEFEELCRDGISFRGRVFKLEVHSLVCDAPARAYLKCIKGHTGYSGCERCEQVGKYLKGRLTFPETSARERTGRSVANMTDEAHHHRVTPLARISIDMVKNVPLDYMHLCCLGVMRMMIRLWMCGPLATRFTSSTALAISRNLAAIRKSIPRDFARRPRSLYEFRLWKATEYRLFLLYVGMIVLKGAAPRNMYKLFLLFSSAMSILLDPELSSVHADYAKSLLLTFVQNFAKVFGNQFIVYNVHNLVHIADDARVYGSLDTVSCFPFENYLHQLKKKVRRPQYPLPQIIKRLSEEQRVARKCCEPRYAEPTPRLRREHINGPLPDNIDVDGQFSEAHGSFFVSISDGNNCIMVRERNKTMVLMVRNIIKTNTGVYALVQRFRDYECFYTYPLKSSELGIFIVKSLSSTLERMPLSQVWTARKCILAGLTETSFVSIPLLHHHVNNASN